MSRKILIVEDDTSFGVILQTWFKKNGFDCALVSTMDSAKKEILNHSFDLLLTDLRLPDGDGIMLLTWIKESKITLPVVVMTSYAEIQSAVSSIKLGAVDYLEKPINPALLKQKIEEVWLNEKPETPVTISKEKETLSEVIIGNSIKAIQMFEDVKLVAPTKMAVLILGESGSGKEYVARLIHEHSTRKGATFIAVDCGSLSKELAPSELFGHVKGSFTSAIADKKGVFEQAAGGTVFLDEVGNLPYEVQVQLLRALQEQKVRPVGAVTDIKVDIRIIAATNEDLDIAITAGKFREDLYHRLNELSLAVPSLRERIEDISIYAEYFLKTANEELGKSIRGFSAETMQIFESYNWPGNLRELRNVIRRAVLFARTDMVMVENLPVLKTTTPKEEDMGQSFALRVENEQEQIEMALRKTNGNKAEAARLLKIDRKTLYNKMHQYGMDI